MLREFQSSSRQAAGYSASLLPLGNFHIQQIDGPRLQAVIQSRHVPIDDYFEPAGVLVVFNFEILHAGRPQRRTLRVPEMPRAASLLRSNPEKRAARAIIQTRLDRQQLVDAPLTVREAVLVDANLVQQSQMQVGQRSGLAVLDMTPALVLSCSATH
jgi:hypothetical protein